MVIRQTNIPWSNDEERKQVGHAAFHAYIAEKLQMGLLWYGDLFSPYFIGTPLDIMRQYIYLTHARSHYTVMVPALQHLYKKYVFERRYEYYRIVVKNHRGGRYIELPRYCEEEDPIYEYNTKRLLPTDVVRVKLFIWPDNPHWLREHWRKLWKEGNKI